MSLLAIRAAPLAACALIGALAACGGGGGGSTPPNTSHVQVSFELPGQSVIETGGSARIVVTLDEASADPIVVPLVESGSAVEGTNYVLAATEARFDPGMIEVTLFVDVKKALALFAPDVELVLTLGDPGNAALGAVTEHHLKITNDALFTELEPNEEVAQANDVGGKIGAGRSGTILGAVEGIGTSDQFDVFAVTALEDTSVELVLDPESAQADVSLWVSDATGALTSMFEAGGAGANEGGAIEVLEGETFYLVVLSLDSPTEYDLFVDGASSVVIAGAGAGDGRDLLMDLGADWPAIARAWVARKSGGRELAPSIEGWGVWIVPGLGRARSFVLERSGS